MVDVQNATLAGGVAVGAISNMGIEPWGAVFTGPALEEKIGLFDTCGVQNLHGYSGIIGGIASAVAVATLDDAKYAALGSSMDASEQAGKQIIALVVTLVVAVVTGLFTGAVLKLQCFSQGLFGEAHLFEDKVNWELEEGAADAGAMEMGSLESALDFAANGGEAAKSS